MANVAERMRASRVWGVLAVYLGASWVVLQIVDVVKQNLGLPDWVFPFALLLLLIGLPIILATALLQGGRSPSSSGDPDAAPTGDERARETDEASTADPASSGRHLFTWRNALLGGGLAFLLLASATGLFMYMRSSGIGPVGSLVAAGVLEEKARVVLSEFESEDETLGRTVTESFRVDLAQSPMVTLVEPDSIADALARMGRPEDTELTEQTARELALRDGIPAVIAGEIASLGAGYVLTARLVSATDGAVLASARASSKDSDGLVEAIDEVSSSLRERIGESYTSLRETPTLAHVTTGSLEALKKYTQAYDARHRDENSEAAIRLLEEAVQIDSTFALAWRDLATVIDNINGSWDQQINATEAAYRHRDRLSEREKYLVEASYHSDITQDYGQVIQAYESMLRLDPDDAQALNNIGFAYWQMVDFENALIWYQKAHTAAPDVSLHLANVAVANANLGNFEAAAEAYAGLDSFPPNPTWDIWHANYLWMAGDEAGARSAAQQIQAEFPNRGTVVWAEGTLGAFELLHGRLENAAAHIERTVEQNLARGAPDNAFGGLLRLARLQMEFYADTTAALAALEDALQRIDPESIAPLDRPWGNIGGFLIDAGEIERGQAYIERGWSEVPERLLPWWEKYRAEDRARIARAEGRPLEALEEIRTVPPGTCVPCRLQREARLFDQAGQADSAVAYYELYLETPFNFRLFVDDNRLAPTHERLGQLYDERGDLENAALHYAAFVELWADADPVLRPRVNAAQDRLEEIIRERGMKQLLESSGRSLWQVLALYAGASWVVLQVVDVVKDNMGLPDWVFPFALLLLLIGLPIIVATALVQGRRVSGSVTDASREAEPDDRLPAAAEPAVHHRLLTWKNSLLGGGLAMVFLAIVTAGFMYMRSSGIGPVGSLVAKGLIDERSEIMVADFEAEDDMLGRMASEALRVDLSQSDIVRLVNPRTVEGALRRMQVPEGTRVDEATAREIAEREGIAAVVGGEILSGGGSYVITAHLVSPGGDLLGNARVTAADSSKIIEAIDKLSRNLREQIGESYTSMRESPALAQVSTNSLEALRKYTEAGVQRREGNLDAAIDFLEEAIAIDSTFAMAYRGIGIFLQNKFDDWSRQYWAHSKAYEYRDRLTEREKWLVSASYHLDIEEDEAAAIAAYENVLRIDPEMMSAVNNIGVIYYIQRDWEKALKQYRLAHEMRPEGLTASNVGVVYANMGDFEQAEEWMALSRELEPNTPGWKFYQVHFENLRGNKDEARRLNRELRESESPDPFWLERTYGTDWLFDVEEGRIARAETSLAAAVEAGDMGEGGNSARALQDLLARAELDLALGEPESTVRRVEAALERFPLEEIPPLDRPTAWAASLYAQAGDTDAARALLAEQREELGPLAERKRVGLAEAEAWIDVGEGRYAEAIPVLRVSDRGYACDICTDLSVGTAFDQAGQPDSAVVYYERYLAPTQNWRAFVDSNWRAWTLERLGQLYDELGDLEQAAGYYAAFVELWAEADPELQPRVQAARARLEDIVRERGMKSRSLWQVLAVYAAASWVVLQVVDIMKDNMGLPDWVFPFALLLLLIGLPIIIATAMVQGKHAADMAAAQATPVDSQELAPQLPATAAHHKIFSWRNALVGGGLAIGLLVLVTGGFMVMRNQGIGPVGSLVAKGMLDERSPVILTDFVAEDPGLSRAATQAFRVDLSQTKIVRVLERSAYAGALERMQKDPSDPLTVEVAREVAVREGIPAVIGGEIVEAGGGYVLTASVVSADLGTVLASHRETAKDDAEIIPAIDRLSRKIREMIGESFTSLRADPPLAAVTTSSLEALKLFSEAQDAIDRRGISDAGIPLLEEALEIDPEFASAWRKLGVQLNNSRRERSRIYEALTRAYELRDRLTPRERYLAEASYYSTVLDDPTRAAGAYDRLLDLDPNDTWALNNLAVIYRSQGDNERALALFERGAAIDSTPIELGNVMFTQVRLGRFEEALQTAAIGHRLHPASASFYFGELGVAWNQEDYEAVLAKVTELKNDLPDDAGAQIGGEFGLANLAWQQGRLEDALEHARDGRAQIRRTNPSNGRYDWPTVRVTLQERADTSGAARLVAEMLAEQPLEELEPLDRPYFAFVNFYSTIGDETRARAMMAAFHDAVPDAPDSRWVDDEAAMNARLAQVTGRYDEAIDHWMRLRELEPGCEDCGFEGIARAHDAAGRFEEAIEWYRRDLEVARIGRPPDRPMIFERLGQLYDETGDLENAAVYYARFVDLWADADPELQPRVQAAQARLEEIVRERG